MRISSVNLGDYTSGGVSKVKQIDVIWQYVLLVDCFYNLIEVGEHEFLSTYFLLELFYFNIDNSLYWSDSKLSCYQIVFVEVH